MSYLKWYAFSDKNQSPLICLQKENENETIYWMGKEVIQFAQRQARKYLEVGLQLVFKGEFEEARTKFKESAKSYRTADALTYWGWMEYQLGNVDDAIKLCKQAIKLDPDFGNPYNDIGSYFVTLGKVEEAIPWFEQAVDCKRYEARHYPHINLGRIFLQKEMPLRALSEFKKALGFSPDDPALIDAVRTLSESLN